MLDVGKNNQLSIVKQVDFGLYLDGGEEFGEILMPARYIPQDWQIGDRLDVFVYRDSEDRLIATTETPFVQVGQCAYLKVVDVGEFGAFLNWGVLKELLVPFREQPVPMEVGRSYVVAVYLDNRGRIAASRRLSRFLQTDHGGLFMPGQAVPLLVCGHSDIGYQAVINHTHLGIIHHNEILNPIQIGDQFTGYIKAIRPDGKINLAIQPRGKDLRDPLAQQILDYIASQGGSTTLTDKSPPEDIYRLFNISKSNYKKALGKLYKENRILLEKDRLTLL